MTKTEAEREAIRQANKDIQFLGILADMQKLGIDTKNFTKKEFNRRTLAAAKATWTLMPGYRQSGENAPKHLPHYINGLANIYECLEELKADVSSDKGFKPLGITKAEFETACRDAVVKTMKGLCAYVSQATDQGAMLAILKNNIEGMMKAGQIDPAQDGIYQESGYASRADFNQHLEGWTYALANPNQLDWCGTRDHRNSPNPRLGI